MSSCPPQDHAAASFPSGLTFYGVPKEFVIMDGDERVTKQGAKKVEEGDDPTRIFKRHRRTPGYHLKQWHHRPGVQKGGGGIGRRGQCGNSSRK